MDISDYSFNLLVASIGFSEEEKQMKKANRKVPRK